MGQSTFTWIATFADGSTTIFRATPDNVLYNLMDYIDSSYDLICLVRLAL